MEIKGDGSVKYRSILFYSNDDNTVDISLVIASVHIFSEIYKIIFGDIILDNLISIEKYEKLTVLKQFSPRFLNNVPVYSEMLLKHRESYGDNIMISSNRLPSSGLRTYDKGYFSEFGIDYNVDNVVDEFFKTLYAVMGFIDKPNNAINSNDSSTKIFSTEQL
jgi:hypothetical protein